MTEDEDFLAPRCRPGRLHDYQLRRDIRDALLRQIPSFHGTLLDVGCGRMPYRALMTEPPSRVTKYIGLDVPGCPHGTPDVVFDGNSIPLPDGSVDCAVATEVLEHSLDPRRTVAEVARVLRPGGTFFFTIPFFWPLHEVPYDYQRITPFALISYLRDAGLEPGPIQAHRAWDGTLAQMIGLWVHYRGMRPWKRAILKLLAWPIVALLNRGDGRSADSMNECSIATGYAGTAKKPESQGG